MRGFTHIAVVCPQVHPYVSTGLAGSKFGIRNTHLQVRAWDTAMNEPSSLGIPSMIRDAAVV